MITHKAMNLIRESAFKFSYLGQQCIRMTFGKMGILRTMKQFVENDMAVWIIVQISKFDYLIKITLIAMQITRHYHFARTGQPDQIALTAAIFTVGLGAPFKLRDNFFSCHFIPSAISHFSFVLARLLLVQGC